MVACIVACFVSLSAPNLQRDTSTFHDAAVAELYSRARVRHIRQDSLVRDYRARVRTRIDVTAGRSRFGRQTALFVHETIADVTWKSRNDLKVDVVGARSAAPVLRMIARVAGPGEVDEELRDEFRQEAFLDRPWFIPRALGDSVRVMGVPNHAALHPLGDGATRYYRYAITDSVRVRLPDRDVHAIKMRVEPKRLGPSLVAGEIWIDRTTADVVRMFVVFLGEYLWEQPERRTAEDSARARRENTWATRFVSAEADIEYALVENRYWLPYRQLLSLTLVSPWLLNATVPARALSTFTDYQVNVSTPMSFAVPLDTLRARSSDPMAEDDKERTRVLVRGEDKNRQLDDWATAAERYANGYYRAGRWGGGRWEVAIPPGPDLATYPWPGEFKVSLEADEERRLRESLVALAELSEDLPDKWVGRTRFGLAWEEFADLFRFNRVQGPSLGVGYQLRPGPEFTTVFAIARFGFGDKRPTAAVGWRRDAPSGRLDLTAYRTVREIEPWSRGLGIGNSLNGVFAGNDDADYYLGTGLGARYLWYDGPLRDLDVGMVFERRRAIEVASDAPVPDIFGDGAFQPNPPVEEGEYLAVSVERPLTVGPVALRPGVSVLAGEGVAGTRAWTSLSIPFSVAQRTGTITLRSGVTRGDALSQLEFRVGGLHTVRGYTYGTKTGREFWSAQLDIALTRSALWSPVVFADAGDTFSSDPLIGVGAGFSALNGLARFGISKGVRPSTGLRFDLMVRAPR